MTYHTNHCWCNESCWDNKNFDGKVMVYFQETLDNDLIDYSHYIKDPDYQKLITIKDDYFDETGWNKRIALEEKYAQEDGLIFDLKKYEKRYKYTFEE